MADTTTTSLTETINLKWISPFFQSKARHYQNPSQFCSGWDPNNGSATVSVPRLNNNEGAPNVSTSVDTEYDATEATDLVPVEMTADESHFDIHEYGMARSLSYTVLEDSIAGNLLGEANTDMAQTLMTAFNDDVTANFASLSHSSGDPVQPLSVLDLDDALFDMAERGVMGTLVGVVSFKQRRNYRTAITATDEATAVYAAAAERAMNAQESPDQGRNAEGYAFEYSNVKFYTSGLTDTANSGAADVGAIFVDGSQDANKKTSTFGRGKRRDFMLEFERKPLGRKVILVGTMRQGTGLLQDDNGQSLITLNT